MQTGGELRRDADPDELATGLIAGLQGRYVLAQASHNVDRMATVIEVALTRIRFFVHASVQGRRLAHPGE